MTMKKVRKMEWTHMQMDLLRWKSSQRTLHLNLRSILVKQTSLWQYSRLINSVRNRLMVLSNFNLFANRLLQDQLHCRREAHWYFLLQRPSPRQIPVVWGLQSSTWMLEVCICRVETSSAQDLHWEQECNISNHWALHYSRRSISLHSDKGWAKVPSDHQCQRSERSTDHDGFLAANYSLCDLAIQVNAPLLKIFIGAVTSKVSRSIWSSQWTRSSSVSLSLYLPAISLECGDFKGTRWSSDLIWISAELPTYKLWKRLWP